jgi:dolichol-phosphate mannosyltransferase
LQHPPKLIVTLLKHWQNGFEVVYTVRTKNKGVSFAKKFTSALYYWLFNKMTSIATEPRATDFRLMDRKVIDTFKQFPERGRMFRGMIDWMGFKRYRVEFSAQERLHGKAVYSYRKLFNLALNSFTSFSLFPLKLAGYLGLLITFFSGALLLGMLVMLFVFHSQIFTPIAILGISNTFLIGIVLISLGFIALYIARIHDEVIDRPLYIISERINFSLDESKSE